MRWVAVVAVAVTMCGPAFAAPDTAEGVPKALVVALTHPDHLAALERAALAAGEPVSACPDANYVTTGDIGIIRPLRVSGGRLVGGVFKESVKQSGCGGDRELNMLTTIAPNGTMTTEPLLPGTTIADPQLQRDSVPFAAGALGTLPPDCDGGSVVNTRYVGEDGQPPGKKPLATEKPRPWSEVWTLDACGKRTDVTMHFTPDETGTDIRADTAAP